MEGKTFNDFDLDPATGEITPNKAAAQPEAQAYPDDAFKENIGTVWKQRIEAGMKPEAVIAAVNKANQKTPLTEAQKQAIRDLAKPQDVTDVQPKNEGAPMTSAEQAAHDEFLAGLEG